MNWNTKYLIPGCSDDDVRVAGNFLDMDLNDMAQFHIDDLVEFPLPEPDNWQRSMNHLPFPATIFTYKLHSLYDVPDTGIVWIAVDLDEPPDETWDITIGGYAFLTKIGADALVPVGQMIYAANPGEWKAGISDRARSKNLQHAGFERMLGPIFKALYLLSCRNITTERIYPTRQQRRYYERRGEPIPNEHRIIVKVPGKGTHTLAGPRRPGEAQIPAHMVRGHFAEYTEERPLFGKYSGRFWIPAHVRGVGDAQPREYVVKPSGVIT